MAYYYLYSTTTGNLLSVSSTPISNAEPDRAVAEYPDKVDLKLYVWNTSSRAFDLRPEKRVVTTYELIEEILLDQEWEDWVNSTNTKAKAALSRLQTLSFVDLKSARATQIFNGLEAIGVLAPGRSEAIRNG